MTIAANQDGLESAKPDLQSMFNQPLDLSGAAFRFRAARSHCIGPGKLAWSFRRRTSVGSTEAASDQSISVSSDRSAHTVEQIESAIDNCVRLGAAEAEGVHDQGRHILARFLLDGHRSAGPVCPSPDW